MAFTLYKQATNNTDVSNSPVYANKHFVLTTTTSNDNAINAVIAGIAEEVPVIKYSTSWGNGPTTLFADKVKEFTNNDIIKTFAATNKNYIPVIATDSWTQQYPQEACNIETSLKFRAYPSSDNMYNTSSYFYLLDKLFKLTTPKKFLFTDNIDNIGLAMESAKNIGFSFGKSIKNINDSIKNLITASKANQSIKWSDIINNILSVVFDNQGERRKNKIEYENINITAGNLGDNTEDLRKLIYEINTVLTNLNHFTKSFGCGIATYSLKYGNTIKDDYTNWLITGWNFKPSVQTTKVKQPSTNQYIICPIYIDFTITLKTAEMIGTEDFKKIFIM